MDNRGDILPGTRRIIAAPVEIKGAFWLVNEMIGYESAAMAMLTSCRVPFGMIIVPSTVIPDPVV